MKHEENPVIPGNHEVLVWPQDIGVAAMIGKVGPKEITYSIFYAEDGVYFAETHNVSNGPWLVAPTVRKHLPKAVAESFPSGVSKLAGGKERRVVDCHSFNGLI